LDTETDQGEAARWAEFQFDHWSSKMGVRPWDVWRRLRNECPVIHSDKHGGFWFVSRYSDVHRVVVETESFTSTQGVTTPRWVAQLPADSDPPEHRRYRSVINPVFAPQRVAEHETWIRQEARDRIAAIADRDRFDVVEDFAAPYSKRFAIRWIGFPAQDLDQLAHWTHIMSSTTTEGNQFSETSELMNVYLVDALQARPSQPEGGDILWAIATGTFGDRQLTMEEKVALLLQVTFGGLHTTSAVLGGALVWLADHPEDRYRLRREPDLMRTAVEEFVRYLSPLSQMTRVARKDVEIAGCPIKAGERVQFGIGSANFDERQFDRPEEVILDRYPNRHLGFGGGPHRCVGSHIGRLGVRIGLEEFLAAFQNFEVDDHHALRYGSGEARLLLSAPFVVTAR
jgi:cytochrome P450